MYINIDVLKDQQLTGGQYSGHSLSIQGGDLPGSNQQDLDPFSYYTSVIVP